jgi:hypothetical protein
MSTSFFCLHSGNRKLEAPDHGEFVCNLGIVVAHPDLRKLLVCRPLTKGIVNLGLPALLNLARTSLSQKPGVNRTGIHSIGTVGRRSRNTDPTQPPEEGSTRTLSDAKMVVFGYVTFNSSRENVKDCHPKVLFIFWHS